MCEIHVSPTALAQDRGPGKPRSFQKAVSSSRRGFLQGRRQRDPPPTERGAPSQPLPASSAVNISHDYSGSTMKWLFLRSRAMFKRYPAKGRAVKPPFFAAGLHGF